MRRLRIFGQGDKLRLRLTGPKGALVVVRRDIPAGCYRRIGSKVLPHGTPVTVLDRGAALDDKGDRGGPLLSVDCLKASHTSVHAA
jgi:hypothetical protein